MATSLLLLPGMETELCWFEVTNLPKPTELIITGRRRKESSCTTGKLGGWGTFKESTLIWTYSPCFQLIVFSCVFICRKQH